MDGITFTELFQMPNGSSSLDEHFNRPNYARLWKCRRLRLENEERERQMATHPPASKPAVGSTHQKIERPQGRKPSSDQQPPGVDL